MVETYTTEVSVPNLFVKRPYGLADNISQANSWLEGDPRGHWRGGIQYQVNCSDSLPTISACFLGDLEGIEPKSPTWDRVWRGSRPFTLYSKVDCTPVGLGLNEQDLLNRESEVVTALAQSSDYAIEQVFYTGDVNNAPAKVYPNLTTVPEQWDVTNRILLQPELTLITGGFDIVQSLSIIEQLAANSFHGEAWIHVPVSVAAFLSNEYLVEARAGVLRTLAGNRIIVGSGYPAAGAPDGQSPDDDTAWIYVTSPVFGIRSGISVFRAIPESLDRNVNTLELIAEQTFLFGWECFLGAVNVYIGEAVSEE